MRFQQILPPEELKEVVRYFWTLESTDQSVASRSFRTIADGCPGLIFQGPADVLFRDQAQKQLPRLLLYGQATRHGEILAGGAFRTIGAYFYPSALTAVFGFNAEELTDSCVDLDLLTSAQEACLSEQLLNTASVEDQVEILAAYLLARVRKSKTPIDTSVRGSLKQLIDSGGRVSLQQVQASLGISERSFQRKFKQAVGMSPKLFARICQFQVSMNQLRSGTFDKLSDVAFEHEYADQSHYIRVFREFAGISPMQYQKRANEVVENFPELLE